MEKIRKRIVNQVWNFVSEIQRGSIGGKIVGYHKIPSKAIRILQSPEDLSHNAVSNMIFRHLMWNIGYYDLLPSGQNIEELSEEIVRQRLYNPDSAKVRIMAMPREFINGVKECVRSIVDLGRANVCTINGNALSGMYGFRKVPRSYLVEVQAHVGSSINNELAGQLLSNKVVINGNAYTILPDGCSVRKIKRNVIEPDKITLGLDNFCNEYLDVNASYYYRYVTSIDTDESPFSLMHHYLYMIGNAETEGVEVSVGEDDGVKVFTFLSDGVRYLMIDSMMQLTVSQMNQKVFPLLVALGIITTTVYLDKCWMFAYNDADHLDCAGLYYMSLAPTCHCKYPIITTNAFTYLVPVARKIDEEKGEKRAIEIIQDFHLCEALPLFPMDVFSRLVDVLIKYESACRGVFIILSGTDYTLEVQPGVFAVGLEAISNVKNKLLGNDSKYIIDPDRFEALQLKCTVVDLLKQSKDAGAISQLEYESISKRVDQLNEAFNSDKLRSLLLHYDYPLTTDDDITIKLRNTLLHGSINIKNKNFSVYGESGALFKTALIFHKLCLSLPLLMAGYQGYIVNNTKVYGFDKTCKTFIKIGC